MNRLEVMVSISSVLPFFSRMRITVDLIISAMRLLKITPITAPISTILCAKRFLFAKKL